MSFEKRYELKFVLNHNELNNALNWLHCQSHCTTRYQPRAVNSLYFDTPDFRSARDNLSGAPRRHKIRLRWYQDEFKTCSPAVLELKLRDGRLGSKQHYPLRCSSPAVHELPIEEISAALREGIQDQPEALQLFNDVLQPVLLVRYLREYYQNIDGLRVTLDRQIVFSSAQAFRRLADTCAVHYPLTIMEIKFPPADKNALSRRLRPLLMRPRRHSKYLTGLAVFGLVNYL